MKKMTVIIPARGGSKGIPRKAVRLLAGKPLIYYVIMACKNAECVKQVVVSTDDSLIEEVARSLGADVIKRPEHLASDHITLDPVVHHAVEELESNGEAIDYVATVQPTSPLLSSKTIEKAFSEFIREGKDTLITTAPQAHHFWIKKGARFVPFYNKRLNRQYLEPTYKETGALVITKREFVTPLSRVGPDLHLFAMPQEEVTDIDRYSDWHAAEKKLSSLRIALRVIANRGTGLGHVSRHVNLLDHLFGHEVMFFANEKDDLAIKFIRAHYYPVTVFKSEAHFLDRLNNFGPDIVINDILDTEKNYVKKLRQNGYFVVNFEDLGEGSGNANLVINSIYEKENPPRHHYYGPGYEILRHEFLILPYKKDVKPAVKKILLSFGGTDPNNLTERVLKSLMRLGLKKVEIDIVLGMGYAKKKRLNSLVAGFNKNGYKIKIAEHTPILGKYMYEADLVITSNGRTVYEVASIGTPCVSISQNQREERHLFSKKSNGIIDLGLAKKLTDNKLDKTIEHVISDYSLRKKNNKELLKYEFRKGIDRVIELIFQKYREFQK